MLVVGASKLLSMCIALHVSSIDESTDTVEFLLIGPFAAECRLGTACSQSLIGTEDFHSLSVARYNKAVC